MYGGARSPIQTSWWQGGIACAPVTPTMRSCSSFAAGRVTPSAKGYRPATGRVPEETKRSKYTLKILTHAAYTMRKSYASTTIILFLPVVAFG